MRLRILEYGGSPKNSQGLRASKMAEGEWAPPLRLEQL